VGCGQKSDIRLAPADGVVTYQGRPLADATVMFAPEKGPLAIGTTDLEGRFTLATGSRKGVAVGNSKVAIYVGGAGGGQSEMQAPERAKTAEEAQAYLKKAGEMQMKRNQEGGPAKPKSIIPSKYEKPDSSGLEYEVKASGTNHFDIKLE
jgi:hypothetical protein